MGKNRQEAFSDGVIAIIITITIMVLELKDPYGADFRVLIPLWPVFMSYVLSFIYVGIYWNKLQYGCYPHVRGWLAVSIRAVCIRTATAVYSRSSINQSKSLHANIV
jgi:uncharacterized membrane protein